MGIVHLVTHAKYNKAILNIFYGIRITTEVFSFVEGKKIKVKIYLLAVVGKFELAKISQLTAQSHPCICKERGW